MGCDGAMVSDLIELRTPLGTVRRGYYGCPSTLRIVMFLKGCTKEHIVRTDFNPEDNRYIVFGWTWNAILRDSAVRHECRNTLQKASVFTIRGRQGSNLA